MELLFLCYRQPGLIPEGYPVQLKQKYVLGRLLLSHLGIAPDSFMITTAYHVHYWVAASIPFNACNTMYTLLTPFIIFLIAGVGWTRLSTPLGEVDVFNTHLHANYSHDYRVPVKFIGNATSGGVDQSDKWAGSMVPHDEYAAIRISQLIELSQIVDLVNKGSSCPVVLAGDLNCKPETLEVDLLQLRLPYLRDAWATATKRSSGTEAAVAAGAADEGLTHAVAWNSFKPRRQVPERIDYVWSDLSCKSAEITLQVTPGGFSYSDHFAVRVELTPSKPQPDTADSESKRTAAAPLVLGTKAVQPADEAQEGNDSSVQELAVQCNMPPEKVKATLLGTCALLEEGVISWGADASTKIAMGGCLLLTLIYCVVCLPIMIPSIQLRGLALSAVVISSGFLCMLSLLLVMNGLIADYAQQRALANIYRHLRVYMTGMHVVPNRAGGFS